MNRTYWENQLENNNNALIFFTRTHFCIKGTRKSSGDSFTDENGYTWGNLHSAERIVTPRNFVQLIFTDDKRLILCIPNFGDEILFDVTDKDLSFLSSFDLLDKKKITKRYYSGIHTITDMVVEQEIKSQVLLSSGEITLMELSEDIRYEENLHAADDDFDDDDYIDDNPHLGERHQYIKVKLPDGILQYFEVVEDSYEWNSHITWELITDEAIIGKIEESEIEREHSFVGRLIERKANRYTLLAAVNDTSGKVEFLATDKAPNGTIVWGQYVDREIEEYRCSFKELDKTIKVG